MVTLLILEKNTDSAGRHPLPPSGLVAIDHFLWLLGLCACSPLV